MHRTIAEACDMVNAFHVKNGVSATQQLAHCPQKRNLDLVYQGQKIKDIAKSLQHNVADSDKRFLRAHLLTEELGELLCAMGNGDEEDTLDGLADLLYVLVGSAVTMDLPLEAAFIEVHESNMSKERQQSDPHGERVRDKGPNYCKPDLARVLSEHRAAQGVCT